MEQVRFKRKTVDMDVMKKQQNRKQVRRTVFYVLLFVTVLMLFLCAAFFVFFRVKGFTVTGNSRYSDEEVVAAAGIEVGSNIFSFKKEDIETAITSALPYVGGVTVSRDFPSGVAIEITEKKAVMYTEINGEYFLMSDDLVVLALTDNSGEVPRDAIKLTTGTVAECLVGRELTFLDTRTRDALLEMYSVLAANDMQYLIKEINIKSRFDIRMAYTDRFSIYIGDIEDFDLKIPFLAKIIEELYDDDTGSIDLSDYREASVSLN